MCKRYLSEDTMIEFDKIDLVNGTYLFENRYHFDVQVNGIIYTSQGYTSKECSNKKRVEFLEKWENSHVA